MKERKEVTEKRAQHHGPVLLHRSNTAIQTHTEIKHAIRAPQAQLPSAFELFNLTLFLSLSTLPSPPLFPPHKPPSPSASPSHTLNYASYAPSVPHIPPTCPPTAPTATIDDNRRVHILALGVIADPHSTHRSSQTTTDVYVHRHTRAARSTQDRQRHQQVKSEDVEWKVESSPLLHMYPLTVHPLTHTVSSARCRMSAGAIHTNKQTCKQAIFVLCRVHDLLSPVRIAAPSS